MITILGLVIIFLTVVSLPRRKNSEVDIDTEKENFESLTGDNTK